MSNIGERLSKDYPKIWVLLGIGMGILGVLGILYDGVISSHAADGVTIAGIGLFYLFEAFHVVEKKNN